MRYLDEIVGKNRWRNHVVATGIRLPLIVDAAA